VDLHYRSNQERSSLGMSYRNPNIVGSHLQLATDISSNSDGHRYAIDTGRPFYALRDRTSSRHQSIAAQLARTPADTLEMLDVPSGVGTKGIGFLRPKVKEPEKVGHDTHGHIGHDNHGGHH
jgi:hypothetical protein